MRLLVFAALLTVVFEAVWRWSPLLRPLRNHLRAMLALFWLTAGAIHFVNVWNVAPSLYHNDTPRFASDAATYHAQAAVIADGLRAGSTAALLDSQIFNYPRVLGLIYVLVGNEPLAGGLFQAVFYLASVISIFLIGRTIFDEKAGLWAAWLTACWPSLLLYGTQTMRWASTTAGLHLVILAAVLAITRAPLYRVVLTGLVGYSFLLGDQPYLARILYVSVGIYAGGLFVLALWSSRWRVPMLRVSVLGLLMYLAYGLLWMQFFQVPASPSAVGPGRDAPSVVAIAPDAPGWLESRLDAAVLPVLMARQKFIAAQEELARDGIVDATALRGAPLFTFREFAANVPTALYWAIFAPTPAALIRAGAGASSIRSYAIAEALIYYTVLPLVLCGIARGLGLGAEARAYVLLILIITGLSYVLFGTVTMNGGTLHRFRQPFVMIHLVFAGAVVSTWLEPRVRRIVRGTGTPSACPTAYEVHA